MWSNVLDKFRAVATELADAAIKECKEFDGALQSTDSAPKEEEWIWVHGYKGTDKDMQCRNNHRYELGVTYHMPDDEIVEKCVSGFHFCDELYQVHRYYDICKNNRFFEVAALVRKEDYKNRHQDSKMVAKSIKFLRELTADEILAPYIGDDEWTDEHKQLALSCGVKYARGIVYTEKLTNLGYSEAFAGYIIQRGAYDVAVTAASQPNLSMDMRAFMILNHIYYRR